ncbi:inositol polyphosphate kinase [Plasmodium gonderi]|uniref:Kinase n=1 Tax=Plasmodium gonderi TaxID=77519 RepID=A0A1Y1JPC9_PLAGO|nr:inositol polyphosphate kinase [Plasmodium gonderi]GAW83368.1 inositol polyphosphate kinase [Plasmodium gonderi]
MNVEEYRHQVGGHCKLIKPKDSSKVYKPLIENEYIFYEKLTKFGASSAESGPLHILKKFIPKFYGVTEIVVEYSSSSEVEDNLFNKKKKKNEKAGEADVEAEVTGEEESSHNGGKYLSFDGHESAQKNPEWQKTDESTGAREYGDKKKSQEVNKTFDEGKAPVEEANWDIYRTYEKTKNEKKKQNKELIKIKKRKKYIPHIVLEDLVYGFKRPCVLDIKMGKRQRKIGASLEKRKRQVEKSFRTTSHSLGFRLCGCQHYNKINDKLFYKDKYWGRNLTKENIPWAIRNWFWNGSLLYDELIPLLLEKLHRFFNCIVELRHYRFWSSSLLWVFDGGLSDKKARSNSLDIRMIDFANTIYLQDNPSVDDEYIFGLKNLIHSMQILNNTIHSMQFLPHEINTCFYSENYKLTRNSNRPIFKKSNSAIFEENERKKKKKKKKIVYVNFDFLKNTNVRRKRNKLYSGNMIGAFSAELATTLSIGESQKGTSDDGLTFYYINKFTRKKKKKKKKLNQMQYMSNSDCPITNDLIFSPYSNPVVILDDDQKNFNDFLDEPLSTNIFPYPMLNFLEQNNSNTIRQVRQNSNLIITPVPFSNVDNKDDNPASGKLLDNVELLENMNIRMLNEKGNFHKLDNIKKLRAHQLELESHRMDDYTYNPFRGSSMRKKNSVDVTDSDGKIKYTYHTCEAEYPEKMKKRSSKRNWNETTENVKIDNFTERIKIEGHKNEPIFTDQVTTMTHKKNLGYYKPDTNDSNIASKQKKLFLKNKNGNKNFIDLVKEETTDAINKKGKIIQNKHYQKYMNKLEEKYASDSKNAKMNVLLFQNNEDKSSISRKGKLFKKSNSGMKYKNNSHEQIIHDVIVKTLKVASRISVDEQTRSTFITHENQPYEKTNQVNINERKSKGNAHFNNDEEKKKENMFINSNNAAGKILSYKHEYTSADEAYQNTVAQNENEHKDRASNRCDFINQFGVNELFNSVVHVQVPEKEEKRDGKKHGGKVEVADGKEKVKQDETTQCAYVEKHQQRSLMYNMKKHWENQRSRTSCGNIQNHSSLNEKKLDLLSRNINLKLFINHSINTEIGERKRKKEEHYFFPFTKDKNKLNFQSVNNDYFSDDNKDTVQIQEKFQRLQGVHGVNRMDRVSRINRRKEHRINNIFAETGRGELMPNHSALCMENSFSYNSDSGIIYNRSSKEHDMKKTQKKETETMYKRCSSCTDILLNIRKGKTKNNKKKYIKKNFFKKINFTSRMKKDIIKTYKKYIFFNYTTHSKHCITPMTDHSQRHDPTYHISDEFNLFNIEYESNRFVHSVANQRNTQKRQKRQKRQKMQSIFNNHNMINNNFPCNQFREKNLIVPLADTNQNYKYLRRSLSEPNFYKFGYFRCVLNDFYGTKINYDNLIKNRLDKSSKVPIYNQIYGFTSNSSDMDSSEASSSY